MGTISSKESTVNESVDFENTPIFRYSSRQKTISFKQSGTNLELEIENP